MEERVNARAGQFLEVVLALAMLVGFVLRRFPGPHLQLPSNHHYLAQLCHLQVHA
jgi:hypothetical protein